MKITKLCGVLRAALLVMLVSLWGCGSGGGSSTSSSVAPVASRSVALSASGGGVYVVQGTSMDGVGIIDLIISYDSATLVTPTVTLGSMVSAALPAVNTNVAGSIHIALISTTPFSGSGPIATISFATQAGTPTISLDSAKLYDTAGKQLQ